MKLRIDRDALAEAVAWVARALPARPVVPLLSGLLLDAASGLALSCFDYDVSARAEVAAEVLEPGTVLVPGRLLAEITRSLSGAQAEFEAAGDSVRLTCGAAEFTLVKLPIEEYPALPALPPAVGTVEAAHLAAAVSQVVPAASRDDTLPMLTGVYAQVEGDTITLAATDRYRLAVRGLPWAPARPDLRVSALIPARALAEAARTMTSGGRVAIALRDAGGSGADGGQDGRATEGMIGFEGGGRRLTTRLLGGEFIKYSSRFPAEFGSCADMPPAPLIEAVRRVSLVAERGSPVRLVFGDGEVVVEAGSQGHARAVERVPAAFTGDERVIAFNPQYLLDGLTAAATPWSDAPAKDGQAKDGQAAKEGKAKEGKAKESAGEPADASKTAGQAAQGMVRLEFTSSARPAVISWVSGSGDVADAGTVPAPGFRYLVVPLRMPGTD